MAADGREVYLTYQVHNEAIVGPETVDCVRALTGMEPDGAASIRKTDAALGVTNTFLPVTTRPVEHLAGAGVEHPDVQAVRAAHVGFGESTEPETWARPKRFG